MYCENCGVKLRGGSLYCDKCGSKVDVEDPRIPAIELVDFGFDDTEAEANANSGNTAALPKKWSLLPMFFSVVSLICVMALCVSVLAYAITYDVRSKRLNRASNLGANNGTAPVTENEAEPEANGGDNSSQAVTQAPVDAVDDETPKTTTAPQTTDGPEQTTTTAPETTAGTTTTTTTAQTNFWDWLLEDEGSEGTATTTAVPEEAVETTVDYDKLCEPARESFIDIMYVSEVYGVLYLRNGPGYEYGFVNYNGIPAGEEADVYAQQFDDELEELWLYVRCKGYTGWANMAALTHTQPELSPNRSHVYFTAKVMAGGAAAYSGAGKAYDKLFTIPAGSYVDIFDFSDDMNWLYVYYNDTYCYVSADSIGF